MFCSVGDRAITHNSDGGGAVFVVVVVVVVVCCDILSALISQRIMRKRDSRVDIANILRTTT